MLPLSAFRSCRAHDLPFGAFAWLTSGDQETVVIANTPAEPFAVVFGSMPFAAAMHELDGDALYTTDWQIEVDPKSATSSTQANSTQGLLMTGKSTANIVIKHEGAVQWSHAPILASNEFLNGLHRGMAFSRWKIVIVVGTERHVLLKIDTSKFHQK